MEYIVKKCPKCQGELHVPENLNSCICMYCGETISLAEPSTEQVSSASAEAVVNNYQKALGELTLLVSDYSSIIPQFTRERYQDSFLEYVNIGETVLLPIERYAALPGMEPKDVIEECTTRLLQEIEREIAQSKGVLQSGSRARLIDQYRFFMAIYLVPMIRYLKLSISEPLTDSLQREWSRKYPKYEFHKAEFEELRKGFDRKGFCFITSAVCETRNRPDDCPELLILRAFRDGYMQEDPHRRALVEQYYAIAPIIVAYLNLCTDQRASYERIWNRYLCRCLEEIDAGNYENCESCYTKMVSDLRKGLPL